MTVQKILTQKLEKSCLLEIDLTDSHKFLQLIVSEAIPFTLRGASTVVFIIDVWFWSYEMYGYGEVIYACFRIYLVDTKI